MKIPTLGSTPELEPTEPMPRMRMDVERESVPGVILRLGVYCSRPARSLTPESRKNSLVNADTDMGTSCRGSALRVAVTITSSITRLGSMSAMTGWQSADRATIVARGFGRDKGPARARAFYVDPRSLGRYVPTSRAHLRDDAAKVYLCAAVLLAFRPPNDLPQETNFKARPDRLVDKGWRCPSREPTRESSAICARCPTATGGRRAGPA